MRKPGLLTGAIVLPPPPPQPMPPYEIIDRASAIVAERDARMWWRYGRISEAQLARVVAEAAPFANASSVQTTVDDARLSATTWQPLTDKQAARPKMTR